jgi:adenylylsulfate kinase
MVVWFTGLSGAGKSTIAHGVQMRLRSLGLACTLLDGDNIRSTICKGLGYTIADRRKLVDTVALMAQTCSQNGVTVLVSCISPFRSQRDSFKHSISGLVEVFVDAPLSICEMRDTKLLYSRARRGEIFDMVGLDLPYEPPLSPDCHCRTNEEQENYCVEQVFSAIIERLQDTANLLDKARPLS